MTQAFLPQLKIQQCAVLKFLVHQKKIIQKIVMFLQDQLIHFIDVYKRQVHNCIKKLRTIIRGLN